MIPLRIALLWHQHQPLYRSPRNGRYSLPWVRLHALKDYYDMAALAGEYPRLRVTFNLVPSLLDQIEDYASGTASDPVLDLARRPASDLDEDQCLALLDLFFSVPYRTMIAPHTRYAALFHKRGERGPAGDYREALSRFKVGDLRDLQVWFHLAWCGATLRRRPEIAGLLKKDEGFTEEEKNALLELQDHFLSEVLPIHGELGAEGIAELSTSPYYHPILPLLCDLASAHEAIPALPLPQVPFRHPEDARSQVLEALDAMQRRFGVRPQGVWPSEGSLSRETLQILGQCGVRWTASDEQVLRASAGADQGAEGVHRPWRLDATGESSPAIFFRDHALSDLVGFTYATWDPREAAADFIGRLRRIASEAPGGVVSIILDGENAWEHYPGNGVPFLRALYEGLTRADDLSTVTFSQALEESESSKGAAGVGRLSGLRAGSWIGGNLATWIGHPEKNKAWTMLAVARQEAQARLGSELASSPVFRALAAAEGSDWFWWFGEDHSSEQDAIFDTSFRDLLHGVYEMLGAPAPLDLDLPIKRSRARAWLAPTGPISPVLDGEVTDYFEWLTAGVCDAEAGQGAMHAAAGLIRRVCFGSDGHSLFVRVDPSHGDVKGLLNDLPDGCLAVEVTSPDPITLRFTLEQGRVTHRGSDAAARFAAGRLLEVDLPLAAPEQVDFFVALAARGGLVQRVPRAGVITLSPGAPPEWSV